MNEFSYDINKIRVCCYTYGIISLITPFLFAANPEISTLKVTYIVFSTAIFVYIMLTFKEVLNNVLGVTSLNIPLSIIVIVAFIAFAASFLPPSKGELVAIINGIIGTIGAISYIFIGILIRKINRDVLLQIKSLKLYSTLLLIAMLAIFSLTTFGILLFIILMTFSYFTLASVFKEISEFQN